MKKIPKWAVKIVRSLIYAIMAFAMAFFGMRCFETAKYGIYFGCTQYVDSSIFEERVQRDVATIQEMLTQRKPDYISQYNRSVSNFRFTVYLNDSFVFGNSEEIKLANSTRIEAFEPISGTIIYDLYYEVNTDFPIEDAYAQEAQRFEQLHDGKTINTAIFLCGCVIAFLILRKEFYENKHSKEERSHPIDDIPFDLLVDVSALLSLLLLVKREGPFEDERETVVLIGLVVIALLIYVLTGTFSRRIASDTLWKGMLLNKMILMSPKVMKNGKPVFVYSVSAFVILILIPIVLFVLHPMAGAIYYGIYAMILLTICIYQFCAVQLVKNRIKQLIDGDYEHPLSNEPLMGVMSDLCDDTNKIADGLKQALEKSISSERLKIELITNVSHDLKTPLTSILSYIDLLKRDHTPEQEKEYLEILTRQANRLKKITDDVLEVSKVSSGNIVIEKEKTDLTELLQQAVGEYEDKLKAKNLKLICNIEENMIVTIDGKQTWRILDNCLNNALKYSKEETRIYLDASMKEEYAVITIKNISNNQLNISSETLLERFVRGDRSRNTEGSGLGLNIAQSLAQLQQGSLDIDIDGDLFKATICLPR